MSLEKTLSWLPYPFMLLVGLLNINQRNRSYPTKIEEIINMKQQTNNHHMTLNCAKYSKINRVKLTVLPSTKGSYLFKWTLKQQKEIVELKNYLKRIGYSKSNIAPLHRGFACNSRYNVTQVKNKQSLLPPFQKKKLLCFFFDTSILLCI